MALGWKGRKGDGSGKWGVRLCEFHCVVRWFWVWIEKVGMRGRFEVCGLERGDGREG